MLLFMCYCGAMHGIMQKKTLALHQRKNVQMTLETYIKKGILYFAVS